MLAGRPRVCLSLLAAMLAGLGCTAQAQESGAGMAPPSPLAGPCKSVAERIASAFPGAEMSPARGNERWQVDLRGGGTIWIPCLTKGISLLLVEPKEPERPPGRRLTIVDRSAEIVSGRPMAGGANTCLQAVMRTQKRAGKIGRSHAREVAETPHFEGRVVFQGADIFCQYDYDEGKRLDFVYKILD